MSCSSLLLHSHKKVHMLGHVMSNHWNSRCYQQVRALHWISIATWQRPWGWHTSLHACMLYMHAWVTHAWCMLMPQLFSCAPQAILKMILHFLSQIKYKVAITTLTHWLVEIFMVLLGLLSSWVKVVLWLVCQKCSAQSMFIMSLYWGSSLHTTSRAAAIKCHCGSQHVLAIMGSDLRCPCYQLWCMDCYSWTLNVALSSYKTVVIWGATILIIRCFSCSQKSMSILQASFRAVHAVSLVLSQFLYLQAASVAILWLALSPMASLVDF